MTTYIPRFFPSAKFNNGTTVVFYNGNGEFLRGEIKQREHVECGKDGKGIVRYSFDLGGRYYKHICERFVALPENEAELRSEIEKEVAVYGEPDLVNNWNSPMPKPYCETCLHNCSTCYLGTYCKDWIENARHYKNRTTKN